MSVRTASAPLAGTCTKCCVTDEPGEKFPSDAFKIGSAHGIARKAHRQATIKAR
jgi:hypothetical protein